MTNPDLPFIDEHETDIEASADEAWSALLEAAGQLFDGRIAPRYARAVRCEDVAATGPRPLAEGATIPGFRVTTLVPGSELVLSGRHRFSEYSLRFRIAPNGADQSRLRAETRAAFPGAAGRVYRLLVIGTGGHEVAVRRLLARVRRATMRRRSNATPG